MRALFNHYRFRILDTILPPRCPMTGELVAENGTISPRYWQKLHFIHTPFCTCCGAPFGDALDDNMICSTCLQRPPIYTKARAVFRYDGISAPMILKFKHADAAHMAPLLARWMQQSGEELLRSSDIIIPVPLHRWRLLTRRYNQAALLAKILARKTHLAYEPLLLKRIRYTPSQGKKTTEQRFQNMRAAFAVSQTQRHKLAGKTVLLIDDVYTSGATVQACAETLLQNGAAHINVLTLARTGFAQ